MEEDDDREENDIPVIKPPPIFLSSVENIRPLLNLLQNIAKDKYDLKILRNNAVKMQPKTPESYSVISKALIKK